MDRVTFRKHRNYLGLTRVSLAKALNVDVDVITKCEWGQKRLTAAQKEDFLYLIAEKRAQLRKNQRERR